MSITVFYSSHLHRQIHLIRIYSRHFQYVGVKKKMNIYTVLRDISFHIFSNVFAKESNLLRIRMN